MDKRLVNSKEDIVKIVVQAIGYEKTEILLGIEFQCIDCYGGVHWPSDHAKEGYQYEVDGDGLKFSDVWREHQSCELEWPESFPAVFVYYFEDTYDRWGNVSIAFFDWVTLKDFENV